MSEASKPERPAAQQAIVDKLQPAMDAVFKAFDIDEEAVDARIDALIAVMDGAKRTKDIELYKQAHLEACDRPVEIYWEYIPKDHNLNEADAEAWFGMWYEPGGHYNRDGRRVD